MNIDKYKDEELVEMIKNNNSNVSECIIELSNRHTGLYKYIASKFSNNDSDQDQSEILNQKEFVVYNSAKSFDKSKSKFSTHFANETKWMCLKNKNKTSKNNFFTYDYSNDLIDVIHFKNNQNKKTDVELEDNYISKALKEISKIKDERAKKIIRMRYFSSENKNCSWKNIAKSVELSIQGCINIHNKYINKIKKEIQKEMINE